MVSKFVPGQDDNSPDIPGVDRHYYEHQLGPRGPQGHFDLSPGSIFDDSYPFRLAVARAKDEARHQLIRAIKDADRDARAASFTGFGNQGLLDSISISRSIDGVEGIPDNDIKL